LTVNQVSFHFQINILDFPDQILTEILTFIPDQFTISQVCRRFYKISCEIKSFKVKFLSVVCDRDENLTESISPSIYNRVVKGNIKELDDDEIFNSIVNSGRKLDSLELCVKSNYHNSNIKLSLVQNRRLILILQRFGYEIKELKVSSVDFHQNVFKILNLMPNLVKIEFFMVTVQANLKEVDLNLQSVGELICMSCGHYVFKVFDCLPGNVLKTIRISQQEDVVHEASKILRNQASIEGIEVDGNLVNLLDWKHLKLNSLRINSYDCPVVKILELQDELKHLSASINHSDFKFLCLNLQVLENLEISVSEALIYEFSDLSKMKNLKSLFVSWKRGNNRTINESLKLFTSGTLLNLEIECLKVKILPTTVSLLGKNCPNVKSIKVKSNSSLSLKKNIMESFQNLESLSFLTQSFQPQNFEKDGAGDFKLTRK
jgi:hypothetical protein